MVYDNNVVDKKNMIGEYDLDGFMKCFFCKIIPTEIKGLHAELRRKV